MKTSIICTAFCAALLAFSHDANALALQIGDSHELGFVNYVPAGDNARLAYVNQLIGMAAGSQGDFFGRHFTRSGNVFAQLPQAVLNGAVKNPSGNNVVNLGTGGLYTYLLATYSSNSRTEVWYVGDLGGTITIPLSASGYGLSGWMLFGPGVPGVPDGGATAMLLGAALVALGVVRRHLKN